MTGTIRTAESGGATHLVVGCNGRFGRMIGRKLKQNGLVVWGIDVQAEADSKKLWDRWIRGSIVEATEKVLAAIKRADYVWLCLPEPDILESLPMLATEMKTTACIVDIASVKSRIASAVARIDSGPGHLSIHPMFGPMDKIVGLNIILVRLRESPATKALEETLESWNAHMTCLTADEHDLVAAYVQVLPHAMLLAFGDTLVRCGKDLSTLRSAGTPVQKLMMILLSRIITNASAAYWSIQVHNPYASQVRQEAQNALRNMDRLSEKAQQADFNRLLNGISQFLLPDLPDLAKQSNRVVEIICEAASKEFDPPPADARRCRPRSRGSVRADRVDHP